jgi:hypothetical protein
MGVKMWMFWFGLVVWLLGTYGTTVVVQVIYVTPSSFTPTTRADAVGLLFDDLPDEVQVSTVPKPLMSPGGSSTRDVTVLHGTISKRAAQPTNGTQVPRAKS